MFENISKGEFTSRKNFVEIDGRIIFTAWYPYPLQHIEKNVVSQNAEFIAYCFNLQQKYDISKFEECVKMLEKSIEINKAHEFNGHLINNQIERLLKQVVK